MNIFKRLLTIGKAEIHSVIDSFEDPINLTEQGIREMKEELGKSVEALAQLKALDIRKKNEAEAEEQTATDYYNKAIVIIQKAEKGDVVASEADRLAKEALKKQASAHEKAQLLLKEHEKLHVECEKMQGNIAHLKSSIAKWENELKTLKARVQVSEATKDINRKMTQMDTGSTVSMLEKLKDRVVQQEALAEAYSDLSKSGKTIDEEIDALVSNNDTEAEEALNRLKETLKKG
ncbi:phage shock protein A [Chryseobacterium lactis]|uniref:Phage shock protein A n=1 Tax=Chryseobacterium lactis TaxID=1241981 RepID=A0A3G6RXM0_CHRLC|nr:PspA/IM30 family protein [Chryseobacterium lactis]AZA81320.1 PspA/IM30 family protein [Chryseobacterium lactis]AZB06320.1 PspA/IM30 family protein [Chryseobacterium lactis]PNW15172.1 phage shock protein A [Chryseobacterium lactis]